MVIVNHTDNEGFQHLVQLPREDANPQYGLRISIDVKQLSVLLGLSTSQALALNEYLWQNDLKTADAFSGFVFERVHNIFKRLDNLTPDEAKLLSNTLVQIIRSYRYGEQPNQ